MAKKRKRSNSRLPHVDERGAARMVDVSQKRVTRRKAVATAEVRLNAKTLAAILHEAGPSQGVSAVSPKGDVFAAARIAGIQAAKRTGELIPLCHPLPVESVSVELEPCPPDRILIRAEAVIRARTGVEMEALTAASVAALTLYDMCKSMDRGIEIGPIRLESKSGGRSGTWRRGR